MIIPYNRQYIDEIDVKSVLKVLKSNLITQGPNVKMFEKAISKKVNSKYAVASNSATSSLHLACMAIGLKKGDWLWTSPNSFVASSNCGLLCGANIDFVDINPQTFNLDVKLLEKKLVKAKRKKKLPKVIIPVHFAGLPCDMKKIFELSKKFKFKIIEDASHALGAKYYSNTIGNCKYSDIAVFSFHPVKMITTIEGGIATTNNKLYSEKMSYLRVHGIIKDKNLMKKKSEGDWYYEQVELGYNYRMNDIQARLGLSQLKKLSKFLHRRKQIAKLYKNQFKDLPIKFQSMNDGSVSSYHLFVIEINKGKKLKQKIYNILRRNKILVNVHYIPIHLQPYYMKKFGFRKGQFQFAEDYYDKAISLPIYYSLKKNEVLRVVNLIKKHL
jgi:UDP-4-amino-4,6-dideoxy-N-acetyl-beta-L-altrosamine transaminase